MKSFKFSSVPFVRLLIPLLLGRLFAAFFQFDIFLYAVFLFLITIGVVFIVLNPKLGYVKRWMSGVAVFLIIVGFGIVKETAVFDPGFYNKTKVYKVEVKDVVKESSGKQQIILSCYPL